MTFTYDLSTPNDITRVRFNLGDTTEATAIFSDEEITFISGEVGTWQKAVIACIRSVIGRLAAEPDMQADWLRIDWRRSADNWKLLLSEKAQELGVGKAKASSGGNHAFRPDGLIKTEPDWEHDTRSSFLQGGSGTW